MLMEQSLRIVNSLFGSIFAWSCSLGSSVHNCAGAVCRKLFCISVCVFRICRLLCY